MAKRSRSSATQHNLLPFDKRNNLIILQLVRKATAHLAGKERVLLQTVEKVIACVAFGNEARDLGSDFPELDPFGAAVGCAEEDQPGCVSADSAVFGVFLGI